MVFVISSRTIRTLSYKCTTAYIQRRIGRIGRKAKNTRKNIEIVKTKNQSNEKTLMRLRV